LCLLPSPLAKAGLWIARGLAAAPATAPASAPGAAGQADSILKTLIGVGICVLAVWVVRCFARPGRLRLVGTPARANTVNPLHVLLGLLAMWLTFSATYQLCDLLVLKPVADPAVRKVLDARCQTACGAIASIVLLAVGLAIAVRTFRRGLARGLGLSSRRWLYDTLRGVVGYLAVLPVWFALWLVTECLFHALNLQSRTHVVLENINVFPPAWKALAVLSVVGVGPLAEEVFFRGLVQSMVRRYTARPWPAILIGSTFFAVVHFNQPQAIPSLFALAVALGYNYERTGRLFSPILIHAIFNAVNLIAWPG
jgi:membrane protease YdiL (CAAX protease family)